MNLDSIAAITSRLTSYAVIGGYALAVHGHVRHTADFDVLTTDRSVLAEDWWAQERRSGAIVECHRGDLEDPLDGVARVRSTLLRLDVVVAKLDWQAALIRRAQPADFGNVVLRVARLSDLVLLKIDAGGHLDLHDAAALVALAGSGSVRREIEGLDLPVSLQQRVNTFLAAAE